MLVTRARKPLKPPKKWKQLLNFRGFKDSRFSILALGSLLSNIGLYIPYYYIGMVTCAFNILARPIN
jgi:hypothetical protein